jgi:hypothetical protein
MAHFIPESTVNRLLNNKIKLGSIEIYNRSIKRIFREVFLSNTYDHNKLIINSTDVIKYIDSLTNITVKKSLLNSIRNMLSKDEYTIYLPYWQKITREYDISKSYSPNKEKLERFISLEELSNIITNSNDKTKKTAKYLIGLIYVTMPSIRGQEIYDTRISESKQTYNYLNPKTMNMHINDHKTIKQYGVKKLHIPSPLHQPIREWIKNNHIKMGSYLLINNKGNKFIQATFSTVLKRLFGISVNILRSIYITEMTHFLENSKNKEETVEWRKKLSKIMGHSMSNQELYYKLWNDTNIKYSSNIFMQNEFNNLKETYIA